MESKHNLKWISGSHASKDWSLYLTQVCNNHPAPADVPLTPPHRHRHRPLLRPRRIKAAEQNSVGHTVSLRRTAQTNNQIKSGASREW